MAEQLFYEDVEVGMEIPPLVKNPTTRQLVKWAGASGDFYEIHYDKDFATAAGLPGVIVHGRLKSAFLGQLLTDWIGEEGTVEKMAVVDGQKCNACSYCVRICPAEVIRLEKVGERHLAVIDEKMCLDCKLCFTGCPEYAVSMVERPVPLQIGTDLGGLSEAEIAAICEAAHMYPDQIVCFCHRVQAKEIVAAILKGAKTPEDISRATGARTGCSVLCIAAVIRLLRGAGLKLVKAPGYQWYGVDVSIWQMTPQLQEKYPEYYLTEDLHEINKVFPGRKSR